MATARAMDQSAKDQALATPPRDVPVTTATVFVSRMTVRAVLVRELRNYGISTVNTFENMDECCEDLRNNPDSLLVIDWEQGEPVVTRVLQAAQGAHRVDTRPIYFIALDLAERVIAVANEFNVMQIHTGEISQAQIVKHLSELLRFSSMTPTCRQAFREIVSLRQSGRLEEVEPIMRRLCDEEPDNIRALVERGAALFELGRYAEAKAWLQDVCAKDSSDLRVQHLLARCLMKLGELAEAQTLLENARLISPHNVERLVDLGQILLNQDKVAEAMGTFQEALAIDEDFQAAKIGKAQCDMLEGHVNEAMKLLGQINSAQELASIFNGAAIIAIHHGRFKEGLNLYKSALSYVAEDNKALSRVFFNLGVGLFKWGKADYARAAFERALELDEGFTKASHNVEFLRMQKFKGDALADARRLPELESLANEDEEIGMVSDRGGAALQTLSPTDEDDEDYLQSLTSDP